MTRPAATTAITTGRMTITHPDEYYQVSEHVAMTPRGDICRISAIKVHAHHQNVVRVGDCYHPGVKTFMVVSGYVRAYTAPAHSPTDITDMELVAGDIFTIPANVVYVLICTPDTVVQGTAHTPLIDSMWTISCSLNLTSL